MRAIARFTSLDGRYFEAERDFEISLSARRPGSTVHPPATPMPEIISAPEISPAPVKPPMTPVQPAPKPPAEKPPGANTPTKSAQRSTLPWTPPWPTLSSPPAADRIPPPPAATNLPKLEDRTPRRTVAIPRAKKNTPAPPKTLLANWRAGNVQSNQTSASRPADAA